MARGQIQKGSQGDDVKHWQNYLIALGYDLGEGGADGIFGDATEAATKKYNTDMGLGADGVVSSATWASMGKAADFSYDPYKESKTVTDARDAATTAANAVTSYGKYDETANATVKGAKDAADTADKALEAYGTKFTYGNEGLYNNVMNKILNREKFTYDFNGDALYQQYKDKYVKQGKMAMGDAIGQASAMTGGYGNSYAQSVGQQAYQAQLENLNDIIPELYQMALDKYNMEGQDLYNQFGMLSSDRSQKYGEWSDGYNRLVDDRNYKRGVYDSERTFDYGQWKDGYDRAIADRNYAWGVYNDERTYDYGVWSDAYDNAWNEHRAGVSDAQWAATYSEDIRQYDESQKKNNEVADDPPHTTDGTHTDDEFFTGELRPEATDPDANIFEYRQDVVNHVVASGVPRDKTGIIMNEAEWQQQRNSYLSSGQGGDYVKYCNNYSEYLTAIAQFLIEQYA